MAINFLQSTKLPDDVKLQFGDSEDLQIYHTGSNSFIQDLGIGSLYIDGSSVYIRANLNENAVVCLQNSEVQIFHNGSEKMATKSTGISVTGGVTTSSSSDLAGANMSAGIAMGTNAITGMADPSSAQDAATKAYVDGALPTVNNPTISITTGSGLDGANSFSLNQNTNKTIALSLDLSEFQDSGTLVGSDHLISLDGNVETKSTISSIPLSIFNNNAGFVTSSGVTSVATSSPITGGTITGTGTIGITQSSGSANGYLSSTDWTTFNNKTSNTGTVTGVTASSPVVSSGGTAPEISMPAANGSTNGYLTSANWTTFNNKGSGSMSSWALTADSGGSETISNGESVDIAGGTNITTSRSGATVTISTSATTNTGTVTSVATGTGLSGGTITGSGTISVDNTVVLTNNTQTISGGKTFSDVLTVTSDIDMESGGDILLSATGGIQIDGDPGVGKFLKSVASGMEWTTITQNSGTVTSVATSSPITGGTITGSGTIGLDQSAITQTGTVTTGTWNSNTTLTKTSSTSVDFQGERVFFGSGTVVKGKVYVYSGGDWIAADADSASTASGTLAVALGNGAASTVGMLTRGIVTLTDLGNDGDMLHLSTNAGNLVVEPPSGTGDIVRIVGQLLDSTNGQTFFNPDYTFITLS